MSLPLPHSCIMPSDKAFNAAFSAFIDKFLPNTYAKQKSNVFDGLTDFRNDKDMASELVRRYGLGVCGWH